MSYIEDKFYFEDWEVNDGDDEESTIISIVNDFFRGQSWYEPEPLEYWVVDPYGGGCISDFPQGDYEDCVEWIRDNFVNSYKLEKN